MRDCLTPLYRVTRELEQTTNRNSHIADSLGIIAVITAVAVVHVVK